MKMTASSRLTSRAPRKEPQPPFQFDFNNTSDGQSSCVPSSATLIRHCDFYYFFFATRWWQQVVAKFENLPRQILVTCCQRVLFCNIYIYIGRYNKEVWTRRWWRRLLLSSTAVGATRVPPSDGTQAYRHALSQNTPDYHLLTFFLLFGRLLREWVRSTAVYPRGSLQPPISWKVDLKNDPDLTQKRFV